MISDVRATNSGRAPEVQQGAHWLWPALQHLHAGTTTRNHHGHYTTVPVLFSFFFFRFFLHEMWTGKCTYAREPLARHSYGKCHAAALRLHGCSYSHDILFRVPVDRVLLLLLLLLPLPRPPPPPPRCLGRGHRRRFTEVRFIGAAWCGACYTHHNRR